MLHNLLVAVGAAARVFVVFRAVDVRAVVKRSVLAAEWSPSALIRKVPVETCVGSMLCAFVILEELALLDAKLFQIAKVKY